jgi:hypothetical protein
MSENPSQLPEEESPKTLADALRSPSEDPTTIIEDSDLSEEKQEWISPQEENISSIQEEESPWEKEENDPYADTSSRVKKVRFASIVVGLIAGLVSIGYAVYRIFFGDVFMIHANDTILIQSNTTSSQGKNSILDDESVLRLLMENERSKNNVIPTNTYIGRIERISEVIQPALWYPISTSTTQELHFPLNLKTLTLTLTKTYDIGKKSKISNQNVTCIIDPINAKYFWEKKNLEFNTIEVPNIKIGTGDIIAFRQVVGGGSCEIFQVNNANLDAYKVEVQDIKNTLQEDQKNTYQVKLQNLPMDGSSSSVFDFMTYWKEDVRTPLAHIWCIPPADQVKKFYDFLLRSQIHLDFGIYTPHSQDDRNRLIFTIDTSGKWRTQEITSNIRYNQKAEFTPWLVVQPIDEFIYNSCRIVKVDVLDIAEEHIIESYSF